MVALYLHWGFLALAGSALGHSLHVRQNGTAQDATALLNKGIDAPGGLAAMTAIQNLAYQGETILRMKTLMLGISVTGVDNTAITAGRQNITFSFEQPHVTQRIDKVASLGPSSTFGRANLAPMDFSIVTEGGENGYAAVVRGSYDLYDPNGGPQGYLDGLLALYLISEAYKWHPLLLATILSENSYTYRQGVSAAGIELPGVHDETLDLTVLFDPQTSLPYIIRSYEDHPFFGASTHDLYISDYTEVNGLQVPHRFKEIYNGKHLLGDYRADQVVVDASLPADFFSVSGNGTIPEPSIPTRDAQYTFAGIGETSSIFLWSGAYTGTPESIAAAVSQPFDDLPGYWDISAEGDLAMRQGLVELEDGSVIVLDAPPHQSKLVIEWARDKLGKNITHVWPTHHHHDHALGAVDYVALGAKLVVPEYAANYYTTVPRENIITYERGGSLVFKDSRVQLVLVDMGATIHAEDHGYAVVLPSCSDESSTVAVFDADHGNLAFIETFDHTAVQELLNSLVKSKVTADAHFLPAHGPAGNIVNLTSVSGFLYPSFSTLDFVHSQPTC